MAKIAPTSPTAATPAAGQPARGGTSPEPKFGEFLVLLDDQANRKVEKAFEMPVGPERRQYVAQTLIDKMRTTQQPLWDTLDGLKAAGHVESFQPLWIQNAIVVKGDEEAETVMAHAAGVAQAIKSATYTLDKPAFEADVLSGEDLGTEGGTSGADDPQWNMTRMRADRAKKQGLDGRGVTVGIIDTGVDFEHPHLKDKYRGYDPTTGAQSHVANWHDSTDEASSVPVDEGAHGTHVAGTVGGKYNDDQTGLAHGSTMVAARGLGEQGGTDGMLLSAFQALVAPRIPTPGQSPGSRRELRLGADVINNSWGSADGLSVAYSNALRNMAAMGVINLFAAGNDGQGGKAGSVGSPASSPYIISVAATDKNDKVAEFSSRGPNPLPTPDSEPVPFVAAPGVDIRSSVPGGGIERGWQGTSMATPAVTGWVALAQQAAEEATGSKFDVLAMKEMLKRAAQDVDEKGVDDNTGYGIPVVPTNMRKLATEVARERGLLPAEKTEEQKVRQPTRTRRTKASSAD